MCGQLVLNHKFEANLSYTVRPSCHKNKILLLKEILIVSFSNNELYMVFPLMAEMRTVRETASVVRGSIKGKGKHLISLRKVRL